MMEWTLLSWLEMQLINHHIYTQICVCRRAICSYLPLLCIAVNSRHKRAINSARYPSSSSSPTVVLLAQGRS